MDFYEDPFLNFRRLSSSLFNSKSTYSRFTDSNVDRCTSKKRKKWKIRGSRGCENCWILIALTLFRPVVPPAKGERGRPCSGLKREI